MLKIQQKICLLHPPGSICRPNGASRTIPDKVVLELLSREYKERGDMVALRITRKGDGDQCPPLPRSHGSDLPLPLGCYDSSRHLHSDILRFEFVAIQDLLYILEEGVHIALVKACCALQAGGLGAADGQGGGTLKK
ncbi:hypothetical protein PO909_032849 [Leuciscus waleckii]